MGHAITLTCADGAAVSAWRAEPAGTPKGGLVVLQEIFGVNQHMRDVTDRFAAAGYLAIAPALFDRVHPGIEIGYGPNEFKQGLEFLGQTKRPETMLDLCAAIVEASAVGKVGEIGRASCRERVCYPV